MEWPPDVQSDAEIVRRVQRGDREAYRALVHRYQDTLFRYALSMLGDRDAATDAAQAAFVSAYGQLDTLRDGASFGGWVYRICANRCRDQLKSRRRRDVSLEDSPADALTAGDRTDERTERNELRRALDGALATLNADYREAFVLKHVEERSYEEMADILGASVPALKMRVHRAREALRSALEEVL